VCASKSPCQGEGQGWNCRGQDVCIGSGKWEIRRIFGTTVSADKFSFVADIAVRFSWEVDGDSRRICCAR